MKINKVLPKNTVTFKTKEGVNRHTTYKWWKAKNKEDLCNEALTTAAYLKESQGYRQRQVALNAKLYGNMSLYSFIGTSSQKLDQATGFPTDRPTFNAVQSCVDTLVSRISQNRPSPVFLTDNSDYRERNLAKQLNGFIGGELYQTKAYEKTAHVLKDALVTGTGCMKVYESQDNKVALERVLLSELFVDQNEAIYGNPRQLYQIKLVDRQVLIEDCPGYRTTIEEAEKANVDNSSDSSKSVSDLVMVVEAWHLKSGKDAKDGRHILACSSGIILDEDFTKDTFPFAFLHYSDRMAGFWAQGISEQLMGTQMEINSILYTISRAIKLVGVPRIFVEDGSKVVKSHFNNDVGSIITYRGTKPVYEVAPCVPQELYAQLQRLIDYAYQQCGVSSLQATSQKPAGLNSGEAIRSYDDISTDRFASLSRKYDNFFIDLSYLIIDLAKDIAERDGKYQTVYPNKDGTKEINLPEMSLLQDPFIIQCFNMSSLPKDPAGRMEKVTEMIQSGMITVKEGRRLLDYPDLGQVEKLANASEERILKILDEIVEDGTYTAPDPFMDLELAVQYVTQYYNLYAAAQLEEEKCQQLRDFHSQATAMVQQAQAAATPPTAPAPQAQPMPLPQSPLVPNAVPQAA